MPHADFSHFVGIDWTGAKGKRHAGLAVALCEAGEGAPKMVSPPSGHRRWSRQDCASWLAGGLGRRKGERVLVGIDSSFGMPFVDEGAYLPGDVLPADVKALWAHVADLCGPEGDFYGGPFVDEHAAYYLRSRGAETLKGRHYSRRMRVPEQLAVDSGAGPCESVFHLIGPSQVGLSGLSTMAMLHHLNRQDHIAIWPFDDMTDARIVVVEIYAAAFAALGGHRGKIRDLAALRPILNRLGAKRMPRLGLDFTDHAADACVTAAALRQIHHDRKYWNPQALSAMVRRTEGWVFGIE
ncbi:hypothetical protein [Kordiimonas lacus]|uniref:DUF429 domain-containing protein n=1 Tax=Kordiimonas lacus TaxID=637679 RepID=A0A1G7BZV3_9PROT|nr:hypothetical protein [Kordiimonas lacus]SDE32602.1 hypothetical protein SAMN04488071_2602 [Kordiimonas lacus]